MDFPLYPVPLVARVAFFSEVALHPGLSPRERRAFWEHQVAGLGDPQSVDAVRVCVLADDTGALRAMVGSAVLALVAREFMEVLMDPRSTAADVSTQARWCERVLSRYHLAGGMTNARYDLVDALRAIGHAGRVVRSGAPFDVVHGFAALPVWRYAP